MIDIFSELVVNNNPADLAGGISQALISTAMGLVIAIPATFFYRLFSKRTEVILEELERQYLLIRDL
jgi:biopolymer transport protein ExbB